MTAGLVRRVAHRVLPEGVKAAIRDARAEARRRATLEAAARAGMVPPQSMWTMVGAADNFLEQGRAFSDYLIEHGRLTPSSQVLDVGCGLGKYAIHLAPYLKDGGYEGFDVEWPSIEWCQLAITPRFPHALFRHTPLKSEMYSPGVEASAAEFAFPYQSGRFDLVFLASVFTHMFAPDVDNYIREIARVLKPGGRCIATVYLLNDRKREGIAAGTAAFTFAIAHGDCRIERPDPPEGAVAYEEATLLGMFERAGLPLAEPVRYGCWADQRVQDQDFVITAKAE